MSDSFQYDDYCAERDKERDLIRAELLRELMKPSEAEWEVLYALGSNPFSVRLKAYIRAFAAERGIQLEEANHD